MVWYYAVRRCLGPGVLAVVTAIPVVLAAADRPKGVKGLDRFNPENETVELFAGMKAGQIDVQLIPRDSKQCRVLVENKTDKPLNVRLPEAFAGVPVLHQAFPPFPPMDDNRNSAPQNVGGGFPMMNNPGGNRALFNMPGGQMNQGNNFFNIPPERVGQLKLKTVCLEHGKPEPRAKIKYEIKPIEAACNKPGVRELCTMLGRGEIGQRTAQVAAWHLANEMSWDALAGIRVKATIGTVPYFTWQELQAGKKVAERAVERAKQSQERSPSEQDSASRR